MTGNIYSTFALIALMIVAFYFLILRPQKKRQQAQAQTMNAITPGTKVMLGSGLFGTVVRIGDKQAIIEIAPGVQLTVLKPAIARVATEADEETEWHSFDDDDENDDEPDAVSRSIADGDSEHDLDPDDPRLEASGNPDHNPFARPADAASPAADTPPAPEGDNPPARDPDPQATSPEDPSDPHPGEGNPPQNKE